MVGVWNCGTFRTEPASSLTCQHLRIWENRIMQTLLLVEDQPEKLKDLESAADGSGWRILTSSNREQAIEYIEGEPIDLVVTDLALHSQGDDRDGLDVLRAARKKDPGVPVILISNYLIPADTDAALKEGAFDIVDR